MKNILSLLFILSASLSFAQISINSSDFANVGDTIYLATNNSVAANTSVGSTGATTWNFSNIGFGSFDTIDYQNPVSTIYSTLFPNATEAFVNDQDFTYYNNSASSVAIDGESGDLFGDGKIYAINYNPDLLILNFPSTYLDSFVVSTQIDSTLDTSIVIPPVFSFDSIRIKRVFSIFSKIDAHGTIQTPSGSFTTIRQYRNWNERDTIWTHTFGGAWALAPLNATTNTTKHLYSWYANNEKYPVFSGEADTKNGNITFAQYKLGTSMSATLANKTDVSCFGACNGSSSVDVVGGALPYSYQWSANAGGQTNDTITNLCTGVYTVTVFDALNDSVVSMITINEPTVLDIDTTGITNETALGNDGAIQVSVNGGTAPYNYLWNTGDTLQNLSGLTFGNYNLNVTDANGCTDTASFSVLTINSVSANLKVSSNLSCNSTCDGEIHLSIGGGVLPYSYQWSTNAGTGNDSSATNLCAGAYSVKVFDVNNDSVVITGLTITEPAALVADTVSVTHESSLVNDGAIDVMVTGGTAPYSYLWSNGNTNQDLIGLTLGSYQCTVTDSNTCTTTLSVTVLNTGTSNGITVYSSDFGSIGEVAYIAFDTTMKNLNVGASGSVNWNLNALQIHNIDTLNFIDPASTGNGSSFPNANLVLARNSDTTYLNKSASGLSIQGLVGDPFNIGFEAVLQFGPTLTIFEFPGSFNTSFISSTVIDTSIDTNVLAVFTKIRAKRIISVDSKMDAFGLMSIPAGSFETALQKMTQITNDSAWGYNVLLGWQAITDFISADTTYKFNWYAKGESYPVIEAECEKANGDGIINVGFKLGNNLLLSVLNKSDAKCAGDCNGFATVNAVTGKPPISYYWDANANNQIGATASNLCKGTYSVLGVDANQDSILATVTIKEPDPLTITIDTIIHEADPGSNGEIHITVKGGTKPYNYNWSNTFQSTNIVTGLAGNLTYTVTVTDQNGCQETEDIAMNSLVSINDIKTEPFDIYPNPVADLLNITGNLNNVERISLINVVGKIEKYLILNSTTNISVDLKDLSSGLYMLQIINFNGTINTFRIAKTN